jgi:predicted HTH domain antitoxin
MSSSKIVVRLTERNLRFVNELRKAERRGRAAIIEELLEQGRIYFTIKKYKEGSVLVGKAAELAGLSVGEMLDILAELNVPSNISREDYLEGTDTVRKLFNRR